MANGNLAFLLHREMEAIGVKNYLNVLPAHPWVNCICKISLSFQIAGSFSSLGLRLIPLMRLLLFQACTWLHQLTLLSPEFSISPVILFSLGQPIDLPVSLIRAKKSSSSVPHASLGGTPPFVPLSSISSHSLHLLPLLPYPHCKLDF